MLSLCPSHFLGTNPMMHQSHSHKSIFVVRQLQTVEKVIKRLKKSTDLDVDSTDPQNTYSLFGKKKGVVEYYTDK